jgi:membrane protein
MVALVLLIFGVLYYTAPNAKVSGVRWVTAGAVLALVAWVVASVLFAFYVANFSSYNKTYGTLGGVVVFLLWMWITNMAILLGAELNAQSERTRRLASDDERGSRWPSQDGATEQKGRSTRSPAASSKRSPS